MLKKLVCALILFPGFAHANLMVLGNEGDYYGPDKPLIIQKNMDGTWSKNLNVLSLPQNINHASLYASSCSKSSCIAAGSYQKVDSYNVFPMIIKSNDHEKTWTVKNTISGIPTFVTETHIHDIQCEKSHCMAVGRLLYPTKGSEEQRALLMVSADEGETWAVSNAGKVNLSGRLSSQLDSIASSGQNWMASGHYYYRKFPSPIPRQSKFFMMSKDNGLSWNEMNLEGGSALPPASGLLFDLKCADNICLQLGTGSQNLPFIARSDDTGNSWKVIKAITGISSSIDSPKVSKVHCDSHFCIAMDTGWNSELLLLISYDAGLSWVSALINQLPGDFKYGGIKKISCLNDNTCVGVGWWRSNNRDNDFYPLILTTHDRGQTWAYQDSAFITPSTTFNSVQCKNLTCHIVGEAEGHPLILTTEDQCHTWVAEPGILGLPANSKGSLSAFLYH